MVAGGIGGSFIPSDSATTTAGAPAIAETRCFVSYAHTLARGIVGSNLPAKAVGTTAGAPATTRTREAATYTPPAAGVIGGNCTPLSRRTTAGAPAAAGTKGAATLAPSVAGGVGGSTLSALSAVTRVGTSAAVGACGSRGSFIPSESAGTTAGAPVTAGPKKKMTSTPAASSIGGCGGWWHWR